MKKIYSIIALMLLFVGSAWGDLVNVSENQVIETYLGDQIKSISELKAALEANADQLFIIQNYGATTANTYTYYTQKTTAESDGTYSYTMSKNYNQYSLVKLTLGDNNSITVQSFSSQYWAASTESQSTLKTNTSETGNSFTIYERSTSPTIDSKTGYAVVENGFSIYSNQTLLNRNNNNAVWNTTNGTGVHGVVYIFKAEANVCTPLSSFDQITEENKLATYTIQAREVARGYLYADVTNHRLDGCGGTQSGSANKNISHNPDDANQQFAFIKKGDNYYLYSVGDSRFATWNSSSPATSPLAGQISLNGQNKVTLTSASTGNNYVILKIGDGTNDGWLNFSHSFDPDVLMNYRTEDDGNRLLIVPTVNSLTEEEYNEALANIIDQVNVTFNVTMEGESTVAKTATVQLTSGASITVDNIPAAVKNDFVTVTINDGQATTATERAVIECTGTLNEETCPIKFSSGYDGATWYQMYLHGENHSNDRAAYIPTTNIKELTNGHGYHFVSSEIDKVNDYAQWAFVGNPYSFHILNKGAGADLELHGCNDGKPLMENKDILNGNSNTESDNIWKTWTMGANTTDGGQAYICTRGGTTPFYLNDRDETLGTWQNNNAKTDKGSAISFTEISDESYSTNIFDGVNTDVPEVVEDAKWGQVTAVSGSENITAFNTAKDAYNSSPSASAYAKVIENLDYSIGNTPTVKGFVITYKGSDGFVNIANTSTKGTGNSIGLKTGDESGYIHAQATDKNDVSQLWIVTSESEGKVKLFNANSQKYMGPNAYGGNQTVSLVDASSAYEWGISWQNNGDFILTNGTGENDHLNYESGSGNVGNLNHWSGSDTWKATEVSTFSVTLNQIGNKYYATICYPFNVTLEGGTAYTATLNDDKSKLILTEIGAIPAGTPAIVIATQPTVTATINGTETEKTPKTETSLSGTYLPISFDSNWLSLGKSNDVAGFYKWNGTTLKRNKAYLILPGNSSKGFTFVFGDDDPTGISTATATDEIMENSVRYNLQGQRVDAGYKGIVIIGGKKYLIK